MAYGSRNYKDFIVSAMNNIVLQAIQTAPFDKTLNGIILESLGNNIYKVSLHGATYTIPSCTGETYNQYDSVWVMAPCSDWDRLFIYGKST